MTVLDQAKSRHHEGIPEEVSATAKVNTARGTRNIQHSIVHGVSCRMGAHTVHLNCDRTSTTIKCKMLPVLCGLIEALSVREHYYK